jgi:fumarate hydratase class II
VASQTGTPTRTEIDGFGAIEVPARALWGAQTERSRRFFHIGAQRMPLPLVHAMAEIKRAAAEVNLELGLLEGAKANAIAQAAARVAAGEFDDEFPLSLWQTGSGTQSHMNVNEVVANLASRQLGGEIGPQRLVHPNDDVNLGQSSNDVFPSAMHVAAVLRMPALRRRCRVCDRRCKSTHGSSRRDQVGARFAGLPDQPGQEFGGYEAQLALAGDTLRQRCRGAPPGHRRHGGRHRSEYTERFGAVAARLAERLGAPFRVAVNPFAALAGHEPGCWVAQRSRAWPWR